MRQKIWCDRWIVKFGERNFGTKHSPSFYGYLWLCSKTFSIAKLLICIWIFLFSGEHWEQQTEGELLRLNDWWTDNLREPCAHSRTSTHKGDLLRGSNGLPRCSWEACCHEDRQRDACTEQGQRNAAVQGEEEESQACNDESWPWPFPACWWLQLLLHY